MKKIITRLVVVLLFGGIGSAQSQSYTLGSVPEAIRNKASVVVHYEDINLDIENIGKATLRMDKVFTVVNEEGKAALLLNLYSSKDVSVEDAEIRVFDANGKQTERYKKKDMRTTASGEGLIEDGYTTYYYVSTTSYPITLEFKYEIKLKGTLNIPAYRFISANEGVVASSYTARVPAGMELRYKAKNTDLEPVITDEGKYKVYKWSVKNLPPLDYEEGAAGGSNKYPHILIASDRFSCYGLEGSLSSWSNFGNWIRDLYKGLDVLPADRQQFFANLVQDAPTEKEKIRRIYNYLQQNFRYVSIQLGIGGYKPFPADFTDKKKYGDCKGLSNYMKAALKSVGIQSYVAIINAEYDQEPVDPAFPANGFNHVILCVPEQKDSIWLECTSSTTDFGELGTFTENRYALLITDEGGVLVPTPKSRSSANVISSTTTLTLSPDMSAISETVFTAKGEYKMILDEILKDKRDDQKMAITYYFGFKQPDDFELTKDPSPEEFRVKLKMSIAKMYDFNSGNKLFMNSRPYRIWSRTLPKADKRKFDFYFRCPFEKTDTTIIKLPSGVAPDVLPNATDLKCAYASFSSKYWYDEKSNAIYSVARLILNQHKIPAGDYTEVKKFFDDIKQDDNQKMVVNKGEAAKKGF